MSPTGWQRASRPAPLRDRIWVVFDGIDADATFTLPDGRTLARADEVVTCVARDLEPDRGFPSFMRALPRLLELRPEAQAAVVGGDEASYGRKAPDGGTWREALEREVAVDPARVHFVGDLPYARHLRPLQVCSLHIHLTRPLVLSWSCVEAMAAGCLVLGTSTPPVEEPIADGANGCLVDFHQPRDRRARRRAAGSGRVARPRPRATRRRSAMRSAAACRRDWRW